VYFANEIKRTERKKQFLTSESTIKRKRESMIIHGRPHKFLQGGNVNILFMIFKLLTISVPSKIILHWENICFSEHDILGLSKWSFQWITNFVNYTINIHYQITNKLSNYEQNTHFIQIAPCFQGSFHWFGMLQVRENEISLRNSWWSWVFAHLRGNIADDVMQMDVQKTLYPCYTTKKILHVTVRITKKRFVSSNSQVY